MLIHVGFEMTYRCPQPTPMLLVLNIHYSRASDLNRPDHLHTLEGEQHLAELQDGSRLWLNKRCCPMPGVYRNRSP